MEEVRQLDRQLYTLEDSRVRQFLILGEEQALLIDTGFADSGVFQRVREMTSLPVRVVLTHADPDHAGGLAPFGEAWLHREDWPMVQAPVELHPLEEGMKLACGGYHLEVIFLPGHTRGSVALWDRERRILFPGDSVQREGPIYMFGAHRNLDQYIASQEKLLALAGLVDTVLPSHHDCPIDPSYIEKNLLDARDLRAGRLAGQPHPTMPCRIYQGRWTQFYYD